MNFSSLVSDVEIPATSHEMPPRFPACSLEIGATEILEIAAMETAMENKSCDEGELRNSADWNPFAVGEGSEEQKWTLIGYDEAGQPHYWLKSYVDACRQADPDFDMWLQKVAPNS